MKIISTQKDIAASRPQPSDTTTLRPSQLKAFHRLDSQQHGILNAPAGWGKSLTLCALIASDLMSCKERKAVICVPQRIISKGFIQQHRLSVPNNGVVSWSVKRNLCETIPEKVAALRSFLMSCPSASLSERVVVTTHKTLVAALHQLDRNQMQEAVRNTTLAIDEAHHVQADDASSNEIGDVVASMLEDDAPTVRFLLATAFFFRGDRLPILEDRFLGRFLRHTIPFDEHWNGLQHLRSYSYEFVAYAATVWKELEYLCSISQVPTLIYCPPERSKLLLGKTKAEFASRVIEIISRHYDVEIWKLGQNHLKPVILDLVTEDHRTEKMRFVMEYGNQVAVILSVGLFREGADWIQAQRVIDLVPSGSDQDRNQRFGRLIRDFPGKSHVSYHSFFPRITAGGTGEERRALSKLFAHFHASLVLENALVPIRVSSKRENDAEKDKEARPTRTDFLGRLDAQTQEGIVSDVHLALADLAAQAESTGSHISHEEALRAVGSVLQDWGIKENVEPLAKQIILVFRRRANLNVPVDDLVDAGFDKVWANEALEGIRAYSAEFGGPTTFREIRQAVRTVFENRWDEMYQQLSELPGPPSSSTRAQWWMNYNRDLHLKGLLSNYRSKRLESISWWTWREPYSDRFNRQFSQLAKFRKCPRPTHKLYPFVCAMRQRYAKGKLSSDRVSKLEGIPWWSWKTKKSFNELCEEAKGHDKEPGRRSRLGQWVWRTRQRYTDGELTREEIAFVEQIPWWSWRSKHETDWEENLKKLANFPRCPTNREQPKLYKFTQQQRAKYRNGDLKDRQIQLLESIPWWTWESHLERRWMAHRDVLSRFDAPPHFEEAPDPYSFMQAQRRRYRAGTLPKKRISSLEAIDWWRWE